MTDIADVNDPAAQLLDEHGRSARSTKSRNCPRCAAGPERRVRSSGFGDAHDTCGQCGYDFHGELTK